VQCLPYLQHIIFVTGYLVLNLTFMNRSTHSRWINLAHVLSHLHAIPAAVTAAVRYCGLFSLLSIKTDTAGKIDPGPPVVNASIYHPTPRNFPCSDKHGTMSRYEFKHINTIRAVPLSGNMGCLKPVTHIGCYEEYEYGGNNAGMFWQHCAM
jgi:hypothetical protein